MIVDDNNTHNEKKSGKKRMSPEERLIIDALEDGIRIAKRKRKDHTNTENAVVGTVSEFLQSFVIIGYTFEGAPIAPIFYAHNQQEADSLSNSLGKLFFELQQKPKQ